MQKSKDRRYEPLSVMLDVCRHGLVGSAVVLNLWVSHTGPGSGEGPGGDDRENESRHTGHRTGSCPTKSSPSLSLFLGFGY